MAVILLVPVIGACTVKPNPRGLGTHQQFGLPPCSFRVLFGIPCPSCGMTTAWSHLVRGQLLGAFSANVGGALLGIATLLLIPWLVVSAACGRYWLGCPSQWAFAAVGGGVLTVTLIAWLIRLL